MSKRDYLEGNLEALLRGTEPQLPMPEERKAAVRAELLAPAESAKGGHMRSLRWVALAAAAVLVVALAGLYLFQGSGSVAFAQVLEGLQKRGYTFTYWSKQEDGALQKMGNGMALPPGLVRWDLPAGQFEGLAIVADSVNHTMRWVTVKGEDLGTVEMPEELQDASDQFLLFRPVEGLWGIADGTEAALGTETRDGIEVAGYRVEQPFEIKGRQCRYIYTIWANATTALPHEVGIATVDPNGQQEGDVTVLREFDFEADVDETLFGLGPEPAVEDVNDGRFVVRPGAGMGDLRLGDPDTRIVDVLGEPEFKMGDQIYQYAGFAVIAREGKVYSIQCGDMKGPGSRHWEVCRCRTVEGIAIGTPEQDLLKTYGEPTMRRTEQESLVLFYRDRNMAFWLRNDQVHAMSFNQVRATKPDQTPSTPPARHP